MGSSTGLDRITWVTGGQTGIDRAVLDFCLKHRLRCGGWCPENRQAEDGPIDRRYPLQPLPGAGYRERTFANVKDSDAIVILYFASLSGGTRYSHEVARQLGKPLLMLNLASLQPADAAARLRTFLQAYAPSSVNISGPRKSEWKEGYGQCQNLLKRIFDSGYSERQNTLN